MIILVHCDKSQESNNAMATYAFRSDKKLKNGKAVSHEIAEIASVYSPIREIFPFYE